MLKTNPAPDVEAVKTPRHRRAEKSAKRPLFAAEVERLKDMQHHCPWSYSTLLGYAKAGLLRTRKVAGTRVVLRQDWYEFIAGTPEDVSDLAEEVA